METYAPYASLAVALGVGLIIGIEREQSTGDEASSGFLGGARTHPLVALTGALAALLSQSFGVWIVVVSFLGVMGLTLSAYINDVRNGADRGMTSEVAFGVSYLLGALALSPGVIEQTPQRLTFVAATGVAVAALLSAKPVMHGIIERTSREDVYATLKFLILSVIALPLLPDENYGPFAALNPYEIGLMIVLIAGIGFAGYIAVRIMGSGKGLAITGLIGGLVSSTSVTLSFSGRAKKQPQIAAACAIAVVSASVIMFPRVLFEVAVVHAELLPKVLYPLGGMTVGGLAAVGFLLWRSRAEGRHKSDEDVDLKNPFELGSAFSFGLIYALVALAAKAANAYFGSGGTYLAGVLAGTTDVDAITLSIANQAKSGLDPSVAATTIMLGATSNTLVKAGMAISLGGWAFGRRIALAFGVALAAGALGLVLMWTVG